MILGRSVGTARLQLRAHGPLLLGGVFVFSHSKMLHSKDDHTKPDTLQGVRACSVEGSVAGLPAVASFWVVQRARPFPGAPAAWRA